MGLEPGYLVSKQVQLVRMLKRGGMGSVWIGEHTALKTQVAVKFISGNLSDNQDMVARFNREATSAARIKSPHVVQIHDHGITADGLPFMVMELLEGEDLSARIKRVGKMPLAEVAAVIVQSCRALSKAHKLDIVHRDIKPGNIFLVDADDDIFVKILDFGIAKTGHDPSEATGTGSIVGTLCYMSPEQLTSAKRVDFQADLWSLGVVAYRAITGELPFSDDDGLGTLLRNMENGIFAPPSMLVPDLPPSVDGFFERLFRKDPASRFGSAKEMADEIVVAFGDRVPASVGRFSVVLGSDDEKTGSPGRADRGSAVSGRTAPSSAAVEPSAAKGDGRGAAATGANGAAKGAEGARAEGSKAGSATAERTLAGTASSPPPEPRTGRNAARTRTVAYVAAAVVVAGGLLVVRSLRDDKAAQPAAEAAPAIASDSTVPSAPEPPRVTPQPLSAPPPASGSTGTVAPSTASAASSSSASSTTAAPASSATPAASSSASAAETSPSATASAKASSGSGTWTKPKWKKPEKDYGF